MHDYLKPLEDILNNSAALESIFDLMVKSQFVKYTHSDYSECPGTDKIDRVIMHGNCIEPRLGDYSVQFAFTIPQNENSKLTKVLNSLNYSHK